NSKLNTINIDFFDLFKFLLVRNLVEVADNVLALGEGGDFHHKC
ncbi:hypothetical protein SAMN05443292_3007, partial [Halpernia frigidisoli]